MAGFVGAIDQGTSSSRYLLFDHDGKCVASHQVDLRMIYPRGSSESWVEQDPLEILESVKKCIHSVCSEYNNELPVAVGITNQRETTIVWDRNTGEPLYNAIVWLDQRSADVCDALSAKHGGTDAFRDVCGLPISSYFSATKLKWLLENCEKIREAAAAGTAIFGTVDSWLLWNLTDHLHMTDVTNASRTMLMDLRTCKWSDEMCEKFGVPMSMLPPKICSNSEVYGTIVDGPLRGVPIGGCVGDQQAAMIGQLCFKPGSVKNTYGTGCFMLMNSGEKLVSSSKGLLSTVCYQLGSTVPVNYALEGSVAVAGVAIKWMIENLGMFSSAVEVSELASKVPTSDGMYFVPAFSGLFAPYWRSDARGVFCGLSFGHRREHFARSVLEAVCYSSYDIVQVMQEETNCRLTSLQVDGGMTASEPLLQFQADILNMDVRRPQCLETTAMGAAIAAGLAVGFWKDVDEVTSAIGGSAHIVSPQMDDKTRTSALSGWRKAIKKSFDE